MDRRPIVLSKNAIALIQIFQKHDDLLDISLGAWDHLTSKELAEDAAKQFIYQLKGQWTPRFMRALRDEIDRIL